MCSLLFFSRIKPLDIYKGNGKSHIFTNAYNNNWSNNILLTKWVFWNTLYTNSLFIPNKYKTITNNIKKEAEYAFTDIFFDLNIKPSDCALSQGIHLFDKQKVGLNKIKLLKTDYTCDTKYFSNYITNYLLNKNVNIKTGCKIINIHIKNKNINFLETQTGEIIRADKYVFCINDKTTHFFKYPILPIAGFSWTFPNNNTYNSVLVSKKMPYKCLIESKHNIFYSQLKDKVRITYGYFPNPNLYYLRTFYQDILPNFPYMFKECITYRPTICMRAVSPDGMPIIGKHDKYNNLYINSAHGFLGWTLSCYSGRLLSDIIDNNIDYNYLSPNRFTFSHWINAWFNN